MPLKYVLSAAVGFSLLCCSRPEVKRPPAITPQDIAAESARFNRFLDSVYDAALDRDPERLTFLGEKKYNSEWTDRSDKAKQREKEILESELQQLNNRFSFEKLNDQSRLSYRVFEYKWRDQINGFRWRFHNYPVNQMDGIQQSLPALLINYHRIDSVPDAEAYIARLEKIPIVFDQVLTGLAHRDSIGIIPPAFVFPLVLDDCRNIISGYPFDDFQGRSPLMNDFITKVYALKNVNDRKKTELIARAKDALLKSVGPAYRQLIDFLTTQSKKATEDDGCWKFPDGEQYYAYALRSITTTEATPDDLFKTGQQEVERIHGEIQEVMKQVKFPGDNIHKFFEFMRTSPKFYFPETDAGRRQYKELATGIIDTMREHLPELFQTLPKAKLVVKEVEPFREKSTGGAFYEDPSDDGKRPGTYYINLYKLANQSIYQAQTLAYHEGIPGHHLQVAIALEQPGIPQFRRHGGSAAFVEGWALYAEQLPKEIGLYKDPYSDFGRLSNEVFRAARLVVDVGIHYKKWSREMAYEYLIKNTSYPEDKCRREVDRYIVWPAQATAYTTGMLRFQELRKLAQEKLKDKFDLREFHDLLLTNGPLPMKLLGENVRGWIERKNQRTTN